MTRALMVVVAGPAGSGKSRHFPVDVFGCDGFNVDLRAAALNGGSSRAIPRAQRLQAQKECEAFVLGHIARSESFAGSVRCGKMLRPVAGCFCGAPAAPVSGMRARARE